MSDQPQVPYQEKPLNDKPLSAMTPGEKAGFLGKALVFFVSGGFIYPTIWVD